VLLAVTPTRAPASSDLFALLWLRGQRPVLLLTAGTLLAAAVLSCLASLIRGRHRVVLALVWLAAIAMLAAWHGPRLAAWVRLLVVYYG
jgi:hypothetical protein